MIKNCFVNKIVLTVVLLSVSLLLSSCTGILRHANDREELPVVTPAVVLQEEMPTSVPDEETVPVPDEPIVPVTEDASAPEPEVPSCSAYLQAEIGSPVTFSCYVQARESWYDNCCSLYAQDETGACYLVRLPCSEDDYSRLIPGQKIMVSGYKSTWGDDIELTDSSFVFMDGNWLAEAQDMTALLGTAELSAHSGEKVCFYGMKIEPMMDGVSVWYRGWDNMAAEGEDTELFFRASFGGNVCTFSVYPSLCEDPEQVIQTLKSLRLGDLVDMSGYLYWYNEPRPRITGIDMAA